MKYKDTVRNYIDTQIVDLYKEERVKNNLGKYKINGKTVLINRWWRHRDSDGFTVHEKKYFENYLYQNGIDWQMYMCV